MLIERNKLEPNTRTLKLTSGEEIICRVISISENSMTIKYPLMFVLSNNSEKLANDVIFSPWVISMDFDAEVVILNKDIIANILPSKIAVEKYNEAIG